MQAQNDSVYIKQLFGKAYNYEVSRPDSALVLYDKIISISKNKYPIYIAKALNYKGIVYNDLGNYDSAVYYYNNSIKSFKKINYDQGIASNYVNIGNTYKLKGDFEKAIFNYLKGISIYEELDDQFRLGISYANLGTFFEDIGDFSKSKENYIKSNAYAKKINDSIQLIYNNYNLSNLYSNQKKIDSAYLFIKKARLYLNKSSNAELNYLVNYGESRILFEKEDYNGALEKGKQALIYSEKTGNPYYKCLSNHLLGNVFFELNNKISAKSYSMKALALAKDHNNKTNLVKVYKQLSDIYKSDGQFVNALEYKELEFELQSELINESQLKNIRSLEIKYETEKKDKEIIEQKLELQEQESEIQKQDSQIIYMTGLTLFLLIAALLIWLIFQQKQQRKNQELLALKREFQIKSLEALIEGEEKERFRIAKELHDGVNGDLSAIKYKLTSMIEMNNKVIKEAITMIDDSCHQVRAISHNLVPPALEKFSLNEATQAYCERMNVTQKESINFQSLGDAFTLSKKAAINIFRIVQELVTNSIKHAKAKEINVQLSFQDHILQVTVEDDGIGFRREDVTSDGIGLSNIDSRIDYLNATVDFLSNEKGTSFTFEIDTKQLDAY